MNKGSHTKNNVISLFSRKFSMRMCTQNWISKCAVGQCNDFLHDMSDETLLSKVCKEDWFLKREISCDADFLVINFWIINKFTGTQTLKMY